MRSVQMDTSSIGAALEVLAADKHHKTRPRNVS